MKTAYTIATGNYLAQAKTVADSFLTHNRSYKYTIFLLDKIEKIDIGFFSGIDIIEVEQLGFPYFDEMVERYTIFELSNALKPYCADYLLQSGNESIVYFDSDIYVYRQLLGLEDALRENEIILTPHLLAPPPDDDHALAESDFLNAGIYNGGFFALKKGENSAQFLIWWKDRMRNKCFVNFAKGLFVDQIWLNFVPLYFDRVCVLRDIGYNASYWNLHERSITFQSGDTYLVNQTVPLSFYHFSGYDFALPQLMSKYQDRFSLADSTDLTHLYDDYIQKVRQNRFEELSLLSCYYVENKKIQEQKETPVSTPPPGWKTKIRNVIKRTLTR